MEEIIRSLCGKTIDVNCGNAAIFRGENMGYENGILTIQDDWGKTVFIDGTRIVAVSEVSDAASRPGFIA